MGVTWIMDSRDTECCDARVEVYYDRTLRTNLVFRNGWIPNYVARSLGSSWFLSNAAGGWQILSDEVFRGLSSAALAEPLFRTLERHHLLLTETNHAGYWHAYREWTTPHFRHPVHHIIISTLRCNLACTYCHAAIVPASAGREHDLDDQTADAILQFALNSRARVQSFEFQGGESLLNRELLRSFIPRLRKAYMSAGKDVYVSVQTNAVLLNDRWMEFFKQHDVSVSTSLDGPPEVHDHQRIFATTCGSTEPAGSRGTYSIVATNANKYDLPILPTITRLSLRFWRQIIDQQLERSQRVVAFQPLYPINSAQKNWSEVGISESEFLESYDTVMRYLKSLWKPGYYPLERRFELALRKLVLARDVDFADFSSPCGMVHSQIVYHTNGDVYTCDEGRDFPEFRLGNVKTDSYEEIVFGQKMRQLKTLSIRSDPECQSCAYRPFCSACPVHERAVGGRLTARHAGTLGCRMTLYIFDTLLGWIKDDPPILRALAAYHGIS